MKKKCIKDLGILTPLSFCSVIEECIFFIDGTLIILKKQTKKPTNPSLNPNQMLD